MRTMNDAIAPSNIDPNSVQLVAGYLNGTYAWSDADWALFPNAVHVGISVRAAYTVGHVLDVETGDATPAESVGWVQARRAAGADPSVYCNGSTWPQVQAAFQSAGVPEPHYWIAKYDGDPTLPAGAVAKQYAGNVPPGIDISSVADYWPGVDTAPIPVPTPIEEDDDMAESLPAGTNVHKTYVIPDGKSKLYLGISGYGDAATILQADYWGATPGASGAAGVGGGFVNLTLGANRPGPVGVDIPAGARILTLRYTANCSVAVGFRTS